MISNKNIPQSIKSWTIKDSFGFTDSENWLDEAEQTEDILMLNNKIDEGILIDVGHYRNGYRTVVIADTEWENPLEVFESNDTTQICDKVYFWIEKYSEGRKKAKSHDNYMKRCLELAAMGEGNVSPNPMVGSVIVHNNKIIGEGYHMKYGEAHAEVNAIRSVKNTELLKESTIYVNLEPCSHYGKTPPCADLIIEKKIPNVVIGCIDTFSKVCGAGITKLKSAGCKVTVGVLEEESKNLNKRFFTYHEKKRPYIILKWAQTLDGFVSKTQNQLDRHENWISNSICKPLVHKLRSTEDSILVGTNTAANDNPSLNIREWSGNNPLRIVIDNDLRLDKNLNLFDKSIPTLVFNSLKNKIDESLEFIKIDFNTNIEVQILNNIFSRKLNSIIIEGGEVVLSSFIRHNLWDEAIIITGNKHFGGGIKAPKLAGNLFESYYLGEDKVEVYKNI